MKKACVLGAGSWGTALAMVLSENSENVSIRKKRKNQVKEINEERTNSKYLKGIKVPENIYCTVDIEDAVND